MKSILTAAATFGPFHHVEMLDDRLRADGIDFQFSVIGDYTLSNDPVEPAPSVPVVPQVVPMLNARMAMYDAGWLSPWEAYLAAMDGEVGDRARITWATAQTVRRDDPLDAAGIVALGKTAEEADALFIAAAAFK